MPDMLAQYVINCQSPKLQGCNMATDKKHDLVHGNSVKVESFRTLIYQCLTVHMPRILAPYISHEHRRRGGGEDTSAQSGNEVLCPELDAGTLRYIRKRHSTCRFPASRHIKH